MSARPLLCVIMCVLSSVSAEPTYVDLGRGFNESTQYWVNVQPFSFTKKIAGRRLDGSWYASNEFTAAEHGGTHVDAPYHFYKDGWKIGDIPLSRLIVPGVLMDLRSEVKNYSDFELKPSYIKNWEETHGPIPEGSVLLIRFGWGIYYNNRTKYFGFEGDNMSMHFPGLTVDAAEYIAKQGTYVGVGVDTPSVDAGKSKIFQAHLLLQGSNIYLIENLDLEKDLPETGFTLIVMPMKITEGTGAPSRVVAILNSGYSVQGSLAVVTILVTAIAKLF